MREEGEKVKEKIGRGDGRKFVKRKKEVGEERKDKEGK